MLEFLSIFLISLFTGMIVIYKLKYDSILKAIRRRSRKLAIQDWQNKLPQILPKYTYPSSKKIEDTGIIALDLEYETERPSPRTNEADQVCLYGSDSEGNGLVAKITKIPGGLTKAELSVYVNEKFYTVKMQGVSKSNYEFSLGNFKLEMVEPFRVWRIWYNGIMKEGESGVLSHGIIHFLWKPLDHPYDNMKDASRDLLAEELRKGKARSLNELTSLITPGYSQFGTLHGTVQMSCKVDSSKLTKISFDRTLNLYGIRHKQFLYHKGILRDNGQRTNRIEFFGFCSSTGVAFRLQGNNGVWLDGQIFFPGKRMIQVFNVDSGAEKLFGDIELPTTFPINGSVSLELKVLAQPVNPSNCVLLKLEINGKLGHGVLFQNFNENIEIDNEKKELNQLWFTDHSNNSTDKIKNSTSTSKDLIGLEEDECTQIPLVGGKGASLARIAQLGNQHSSNFKTARGFCVTTNMFRRTVNLSQIKEIFKAQVSANDSVMEKTCSTVMTTIKSSPALCELQSILPKFLESTFGQGSSSSRYAVRSSGVLEDGAELACAGQNETFLGVEENSIAEKVIECWCSLFTPQSVSYRLNHGQHAVSEIAVVVQEMVDASSAGVMFTADPRIGNPFEMLVTANFGLGESVVSASCDPDTFTLHRIPAKLSKVASPMTTDSWKVNIASRTLGEKKSKIIMAESTTSQTMMSGDDSKNFSLDDPTLLKLGSIGIQLESQLGNMKPVDIEWAVTKNGEIFILQSRPITSLDAWTDFEITHEFNSALRSNFELFTRANIGEVAPNVIFPLGVQGSMRVMDLAVQESQLRISGQELCPFTIRTIPIFGQKLFLDVIGTLYAMADDNPNAPSIACGDLSVFGRPVMTKEIHDVAKFRYGYRSKWDTLRGLKMVYDSVSKSKSLIERAELKYKDMQLDYSLVEQTPKSVYEQISRDFEHILDVTSVHMAMSSASSSTLLLAFMFLTEQKEVKDWTPSLYEDAGIILSAYSAVESAEIPIDITQLGKTIVEHGDQPEEFLKLNKSQNSMEWLRSDSVIEEAVNEFFKKHGHRSVAEMDLGQKSWKKDPAQLVNLLKNTVRGQLELKNNPTSSQTSPRPIFENDDELLSSLRTPLKSFSKRLLKFILPYCRRSVAFREKSKSLTVRIISLVKEGYYLLGELMTRNQLIPNSELVPYLTHHELGLLIKRDPSAPTILYKALRRSKLNSVLNGCQYPEMCVGFPTPINNSEEVEVTDVIRGTPVSSGVVQGIAKVCRSVEEASNLIFPGDILITTGTDVAWSPFFPIVGGVVTELGGLISHGAVVAREYGLPCIVGAVNATRIFHSGDEVILDTSTGTLSKVKSACN